MVRFNKNNKKTLGFTLVELLAVIVILSVILIIGVPTLVSNIKGKKQIASNKVYDLIKSAARNYEIDYNIRERQSLAVKDLCERYIACPIIDPMTNEEIDGYISIGDGEYNFIGLIKLDVDLAGGSPSQSFEEKYPAYTIIKLLEPTKANNDFVRWEIVKGNSTIDDDKLKLGNTDTEIYAIWQNWPTLTVDLDGGTNGQSFATYYKSGTTIELIPPTKADYLFIGWKVTSGDSTVSKNNFTMGSKATVLKATWVEEPLTYSYWCDGGSVGSEPYNFTYTGKCTGIDDGNGNWRVKFLTSGTLVFNKKAPSIDVFLVGGGGGGAGYHGNHAACGGGGGYTKTVKNVVTAINTNYSIVIGGGGGGGSSSNGGSSGGKSSAFGATANGGGGAKYTSGAGYGGSGGSGGGSGTLGGKQGAGGSDGSDGYGGYKGAGQGTTTREFGETDGTLYAGGGGGGGGDARQYGGSITYGTSGGAGGGGTGGTGGNGSAGAANTGGGGGAGGFSCSGDDNDPYYYRAGGKGGSGIVVIRNARQ